MVEVGIRPRRRSPNPFSRRACRARMEPVDGLAPEARAALASANFNWNVDQVEAAMKALGLDFPAAVAWLDAWAARKEQER